MRVAAFVPIKTNNERLPGKNTKLLGGKPLLNYILETLLQVKEIDERYVYCSDDSVRQFLPDGIQFLKRSTSLDLPTTSFNDVLISFARDVDADIYVLTHATAPFLSCETFSRGIRKVLSGQYDCALTVEKMQEFLWKDERPFNYDPAHIPRTQDLEPYYRETCGLYIYSSSLMRAKGRRIGEMPYLIEVSKREACDINNQEDFDIAEAIATGINTNNKNVFGGGTAG